MPLLSVFNENIREYERWYDDNELIYQAELNALRKLVPSTGIGMEIGCGTGRFTVPLGIKVGVEPALNMAEIARAKGISVCQAFGEKLPFEDSQFDFVVLVTVLCFVKNVSLILQEARRVLKSRARIVLGLIDRNSVLGRVYESRKKKSTFYKSAHFYSVSEIMELMQQNGFSGFQCYQTILGNPDQISMLYQVYEGHGKGAFVVLSAEKNQLDEIKPRDK
ncbi:class I SAM-dependent methyltransferase [Acidobacteriota bacterium]